MLQEKWYLDSSQESVSMKPFSSPKLLILQNPKIKKKKKAGYYFSTSRVLFQDWDPMWGIRDFWRRNSWPRGLEQSLKIRACLSCGWGKTTSKINLSARIKTTNCPIPTPGHLGGHPSAKQREKSPLSRPSPHPYPPSSQSNEPYILSVLMAAYLGC